ncbi:hypothetical protein F2Q69_00011031 [Brassica cretica]|uniref:Uncharacterized protein n=1 Tax=Brassica cretica TaxID=69181 RepID=A0A8S9R7M9_BRACR|nr:hypothetical protein F2Q69_00011031 [Brassica cretica]
MVPWTFLADWETWVRTCPSTIHLKECVGVGNVDAIYYEGLHRATSLGVEEGINVLKANVPKHGLSTLADILRMPW